MFLFVLNCTVASFGHSFLAQKLREIHFTIVVASWKLQTRSHVFSKRIQDPRCEVLLTHSVTDLSLTAEEETRIEATMSRSFARNNDQH